MLVGKVSQSQAGLSQQLFLPKMQSTTDSVICTHAEHYEVLMSLRVGQTALKASGANVVIPAVAACQTTCGLFTVLYMAVDETELLQFDHFV